MEVYKKRKNPNTYCFNFYSFNPHVGCVNFVAHADQIQMILSNNIGYDFAKRYDFIFDFIRCGKAIDADDGCNISFVTNMPRYKLIRICDEVINILLGATLSKRDKGESENYALSWFILLKHIVTYSKVTAYTMNYTDTDSCYPHTSFSPEPPTE